MERPRSIATLARRLATIRQYHRQAGQPFDAGDPVLRDTWRGIRRARTLPPRNKVPTVTEVLRALLTALPDTTAGIRDRALLLVGFAGAFRRSELVAIEVADCGWHRDGLIITVPEAGATPASPSVDVGLPYGTHAETCPVRALAHWLAVAGIGDGPLFRPVTRHGSILPQALSDRGVALVIKRTVGIARDAARAAGNAVLAESLDPSRYAGHSLRAGFIVSAAAAGVSERDIMRHTRHKRADTLLKYAQHAALFRQNAAAQVGL
jgi:integrase